MGNTISKEGPPGADGKMEKNMESDLLNGKSAAKPTKKLRQMPMRAPYVVRFKFFYVHSSRLHSGLPSEPPPSAPLGFPFGPLEAPV